MYLVNCEVLKQNIKSDEPFVCGVWTQLWKWAQIPFDIIRAHYYQFGDSLWWACVRIHIITLWSRWYNSTQAKTNCTCFEHRTLYFVNTVGLPLVCCSASLACLFFVSFCWCCCWCCYCCIRIALMPDAKWNEKVRLSLNYLLLYLYIEGIQCKIILCLSMYYITYYFLSSTPFRSQRQNLNRFIFSNIRNRNQNQCVYVNWLRRKKKQYNIMEPKLANGQSGCMGANVFRCEHFQIFSFVGVEPVVSCFGITVLCGFWHTKHAHQSCLRAMIVCRYIIFGERIILFFFSVQTLLKLH